MPNIGDAPVAPLINPTGANVGNIFAGTPAVGSAITATSLPTSGSINLNPPTTIQPGATLPIPQAPASSVPVATNNPAPVTNKSVAAPVSTKSIYRIGGDIYDAQTQQKIANPDVLAKDYASAKEVAAPTTTTPTETPVVTTPTASEQSGISGYDAALKAEAANKIETDKQTAVDKATKISNLLSQGYGDVNTIAANTGMTVDEVNNLISSDESLSYKLGINKNSDQQDKAYKDYKASIDSITNGTFALTPSEQADINAIQASFDKLRTQQLVANQNYEGAVQTGEIRSGRQEFMNQISSGIFKQAVDDGVTKIADIESKASAAIRAYKDAVESKNYKAANDQFTAVSKYMADKSDAIKELHTATMEEYQRQNDLIKSSNDSITAALNQKKLSQDIATSTIEGLTPALAGASDEVIQDLAKYYGIDPNILTGSVIGESQKFEKDMIAKGYRTINPADVDKMRATGADVVTYSGRAYMKEPELKSFTNKGNIDFYKGTTKVGTSALTGGGPSVGASSDAKELKAFNDDVASIQEKAAAGTYTTDAARKMLWQRYGASPTRPTGLTNADISIIIPD